MYRCAVNLSKNCYGTNLGYRGMCSNCYKQLVEEGLIKQGDKFDDFPAWLQAMIRFQDAEDHENARHPLEDYSEVVENQLEGNNTGRKYAKMPSCV